MALSASQIVSPKKLLLLSLFGLIYPSIPKILFGLGQNEKLPFGYIKLRLAGRKASPMTNLIHQWSGGSMNFTWESLVLIVAGVILLRVSGMKSIAQMTSTQTVVMISIGRTIIVQPIIKYSLFKTLIAAAIFTITLIVIEWIQMRSNFIEKMLTGKAKVVIENGQLHIENLKKMRLTVDQLEMHLRLHGVTAIQDVKIATLEANGQLGIE